MTSANSLLSASAGGLLGPLFQESPSLGPSSPSCPRVSGKVEQSGPRGTTGCTWPPVPRMQPAQPSPLTAAHLVLALGQARPRGVGRCQDRPRGVARPRPHPRRCSGIQEPPTFTAAQGHPPSEGGKGSTRTATERGSFKSRLGRWLSYAGLSSSSLWGNDPSPMRTSLSVLCVLLGPPLARGDDRGSRGRLVSGVRLQSAWGPAGRGGTPRCSPASDCAGGARAAPPGRRVGGHPVPWQPLGTQAPPPGFLTLGACA